MSIRKPQTYITYSKNSDIRGRMPSIFDYLEPKWSDQEKENFLNKMRNEAFKWLNNRLEGFELETFALDNEKSGIEADYAIYLTLRGATKKADPKIINSFKDDAESGLEAIQKFKTSRKKLNSQVSRISKNRKNFKDFGNLGG